MKRRLAATVSGAAFAFAPFQRKRRESASNRIAFNGDDTEVRASVLRRVVSLDGRQSFPPHILFRHELAINLTDN